MAEWSGPANEHIGGPTSSCPTGGSIIAFEWRHSVTTLQREVEDRWYERNAVSAATRLCELAVKIVGLGLGQLSVERLDPGGKSDTMLHSAPTEPTFTWVPLEAPESPAEGLLPACDSQPSWLRECIQSLNLRACVRLLDDMTIRVVLSHEGDDSPDFFRESRTSDVARIAKAAFQMIRTLASEAMTTNLPDESPGAIVLDNLGKMVSIVSKEPMTVLVCREQLLIHPLKPRPGGKVAIGTEDFQGLCDGVRDQSGSVFLLARGSKGRAITQLKFSPDQRDLRALFLKAQADGAELFVTASVVQNGPGEVLQARLLRNLFCNEADLDGATK